MITLEEIILDPQTHELAMRITESLFGSCPKVMTIVYEPNKEGRMVETYLLSNEQAHSVMSILKRGY